jgi:tight adherence protein B
LQPDLIFPALLLLAVALAAPIVLYVDRRRERLRANLEQVVWGNEPVSMVQQVRRGIRIEQTGNEWFKELCYKGLRYDPEAPRRIPALLVLFAGVIAVVSIFIFGRIVFPEWVAALGGLVAGVVTIRGLFGWDQDRYSIKLLRQLPDTIEMMVSAVRAGLPVAEAFRAVSRDAPEPTRAEFSQVVNEIALGRPIDEAVLNVFRRTHVSEYAILSVTLAVQMKSGGRLAEMIQTLANSIRQRIHIAARAKAVAGESKVSAIILCALPPVVGIISSFTNPENLNLLLSDQRGRRLLAYGVIGLILGILTMGRMIRKATSE